MDGREGMTLPGSASYYLNRSGIAGPAGSAPAPNFHVTGGISGASQSGGIHAPPVFKPLQNPSIPLQPNVGLSGGNVSSSSFHVENPSPNFPQGRSMAIVPTASQSAEPIKKKRGRPRKYAPDGANVSLGLSPLSASKRSSSAVDSSGEKTRRGRPPGTGWKQQLANVGMFLFLFISL